MLQKYRGVGFAPAFNEFSEKSFASEPSRCICTHMPDDTFFVFLLELRDLAASLIHTRKNELTGWSVPARARFIRWFGRGDQEIRAYVQYGLSRCAVALNQLSSKSFAQYENNPDLDIIHATVACKANAERRTIGFTHLFCKMPDISHGRDSKLGTLIHEVIRFDDIFESDDDIYRFSENPIPAESCLSIADRNADNFAGYILSNE